MRCGDELGQEAWQTLERCRGKLGLEVLDAESRLERCARLGPWCSCPRCADFVWIEEGATLPLSATLLSCLIEEELAASASPCDAAASTLLAVMSPSASLLSSSEGMMSPSAFLPRWR